MSTAKKRRRRTAPPARQNPTFGTPPQAIGREWSPMADVYHVVLTRSWGQFLALVGGCFLAINAVFAVAFYLQPGSIANTDRSFEDAFYFSVQTLATIGYGAMSPATRYGHLLVTLEAIVGMVMTALVTGVTFARFARPTARVLFSEKAVICPRNGVPHLMFRMANWRHNTIMEAQLRVFLLRREKTQEGEELRRPVEIPLVRERSAAFMLTWTAMHLIDEASPFYSGVGGCSEAMSHLLAEDAQLFLGLSGMDETLSQTIHARHAYRLSDIVVGARFHDVLTIYPDGRRIIDYRYFHEVIPVPMPPMVAKLPVPMTAATHGR